MQNSIYEFMHVGTVHFKAFPQCTLGTGPIVETIRKIAEDSFFTAIEVGWIKDIKVRAEAAKVLESSHLVVAYGCQPALFSQKLNLNALKPKERQRAVNQVKNCIREAYQLGAKQIRVAAGKDPGPGQREEAKKLLVDSLHQVLEYAKEFGSPDITLKVFDRDIDKESLIGPVDDVLEIAKVLCPEYENFGLLYDLSHFPLLREDPQAVIPRVKQYLKSVHIGNCLVRDRKDIRWGDLQPRFGIPEGEIGVEEVAEYFRLLVQEGFLNRQDRPIVSAEVRPLLEYETSEVVLASTKRVIQQAWALA